MLEIIREQLAATQTKLIAVSKTKPVEAIEKMYAKGQRLFGENRAQEAAEKYEKLPKDIEWHLIGHLQRNKVKEIAPFAAMIHSADSARLIAEIDKRAAENDRVIDILLQFHIAEEESKYGWQNAETVLEFLRSDDFSALQNVQVCGVMGMATFTSDKEKVRTEFQKLKQYFDRLQSDFFADDAAFKEISMGMSGDYKIAIEEGSTMVRIGSLLFGSR